MDLRRMDLKRVEAGSEGVRNKEKGGRKKEQKQGTRNNAETASSKVRNSKLGEPVSPEDLLHHAERPRGRILPSKEKQKHQNAT